MGEFAFVTLCRSKQAAAAQLLLFVFGVFLPNYSAEYEYTIRTE